MNERIRELYIQVCKDNNLPFTVEHNSSYMLDNFADKFSELIIRECANITLDYKNQDHYMGWLDHGEEIARQFGVER